jgi:hypothetical protein
MARLGDGFFSVPRRLLREALVRLPLRARAHQLLPSEERWDLSIPVTEFKLRNQFKLCHPDRSEAQGRDLQFVGGRTES